MPELKAKVWFGDESIIQKNPRNTKVKDPDRYFELEYKENNYDSALGKIRRKIKEAIKGKKSWGVIIY